MKEVIKFANWITDYIGMSTRFVRQWEDGPDKIPYWITRDENLKGKMFYTTEELYKIYKEETKKK